MKPRFEILHKTGDEMCTVVFRADSATICGDAGNNSVEIPLCVRYEKTLKSDIEARYAEWLELAIETFRKETHMTEEEIIKMLVETTARSKSNTKRLDKIESEAGKTSEAINRMAVAVERLATEQGHQAEAQRSVGQKIEKLDEKIDAIETAPAREARDIRKKIIEGVAMLVIGAIFGALFALIFK